MSYQCEIKDQPARTTLAIRTRTDVQNLPKLLGQGYGAIAGYLGELGEQPAGPPFAIYYNMDMEDLDVEMGFPVAKPLPGRAEMKTGAIPGGRMAICLNTGPYSDMAPAYEALSQLVNDEGCETTGVVYELYLNDPADTPPAELQTQIMFPLKSA